MRFVSLPSMVNLDGEYLFKRGPQEEINDNWLVLFCLCSEDRNWWRKENEKELQGWERLWSFWKTLWKCTNGFNAISWENLKHTGSFIVWEFQNAIKDGLELSFVWEECLDVISSLSCFWFYLPYSWIYIIWSPWDFSVTIMYSDHPRKLPSDTFAM